MKKYQKTFWVAISSLVVLLIVVSLSRHILTVPGRYYNTVAGRAYCRTKISYLYSIETPLILGWAATVISLFFTHKAK